MDPPDVAPIQPGGAGHEWLVVVGEFGPGGYSSLGSWTPSGASNRIRGVLWGARIDRLVDCDWRSGPNRVEITVPATPEVMRLVGDPSGEVDQMGRPLYTLANIINRELMVGSTSNGRIRWRFVVRDPATVEGGQLRLTGVGILGGLTSDRIIGAPTRLDRLGGRGSFPKQSLSGSGFRAHGGAQVQIVPGGVDAGYALRVRGPAGAYAEIAVRRKTAPGQPGAGQLAATAWVRLPSIGPEIDDFGLMTVAVTDVATNRYAWPKPQVGDPDAAVVTEDMPRGEWGTDQAVALAYIKKPPYDYWFRVRCWALDDNQWTYFDGVKLLYYEADGTLFPVDTTAHVARLITVSQTARAKSRWGVDTKIGAPSGIVEVGQWVHEDAQPLDEAIEAVPGVEVWDDASEGRNVRVAKRRGRVRNDVVIRDWDVVGKVTWSVDPGAQRTAVRGVSSAGSIWGGADVGAIDTSQSRGQVIDVTLTGPAGLTPRRLQQWADQQLAGLRLLQGTTTLLVTWGMGMRLGVGDTVQVALTSGAAIHKDWMRINAWVPDLVGQQFVAIELGTDGEKGGKR